MDVLEILRNLKEDADFEESTDFIEDGLLDSFEIVELVSALEDAFEIEISGRDIIPDYLRASYETVQKMTGMELDVLRLMTEEKSNGEIGEYLDISTNTVKFHVKKSLKKLQLL